MAGRTTEQRARDLFDPFHFLTQPGVPDQALEDPWPFYRDSILDWPELSPHPLFDSRHYLERHPELVETGGNPLIHYLDHSPRGAAGDPHPLFDEAFYRRTQMTGEVLSLSSLEHYESFYRSDHPPNPNRVFETAYFLRHNPDVAAAGVNPLAHFATNHGTEARIVSERLSKRLIDLLGWNDGPTPSDFSRRRVIVVLGEDDLEKTQAEVLAKSGGNPDRFKNESEEWIWVIDSSSDPGLDPALREHALILGECLHARNEPVTEAEITTALRSLSSPYKPTTIFAADEFRDHLSEPGIRSIHDLSAPESRPERDSEAPSSGGRRVIIPLVDWEISGVNTWVENVSRGLADAGWEVILLATPDFYRYTKSSVLPGLGIRLVRISPRNPRWFWNQLRDFFESQAPAIVLTAYDFKVNSIAPACGDHLAFVGVLHSDDEEYYEQQRRLGPSFAHTIAVSNHIRETVKESFSLEDSEVDLIPYGVPGAEREAAPPPAASEPIRLVYTGRIVQKQKRILEMGDLVDALDARGIDFRLTLIGDGTEKETLEERLAGPIREGRVTLTGRLEAAEVAGHLSKSHVFVLLSEWEGLPLSLLEAMAHGVVPVVSQIDSGIPELIREGETGYTVPLGAFDQYAEVIERLWKNEDLWGSISPRTRFFFESRFTTEKMVEKTDSVLDSVWNRIPVAREPVTPAPGEGKRVGAVPLPVR